MPLDAKLLSILACPACRGKLVDAGESEGLVCPKCSLVYPVKDDIPIMLAEEAIPLQDWRRGKRGTAQKA